jgi:hypothetical protein
VNKKCTQKYGHLPPKIVISTPWEALCVDLLVGPYTLKCKDVSSIDFMALTMINPASSWFEVVELPTIMRLMTKKVNGKERTIEEEIFDKSPDRISQLVNKILLCRYPQCHYLIYDNGLEFKLHIETFCYSYGIKREPTTIKNPQANAICEHVHQVFGTMMRTSEIDMANSVEPADMDTFIDNAAWAFAQHTTQY